ncbi:hypothetical protein M2323_003925 [Rhodoblastus acidophilus]|uniref:hypothetical protein n=1 Tax=Rhodoblastus acidophilus TaxID=1074 RepID=UPI00222490EC|nr:hypothetical protein [Rhodoblastus acidophilus]MCW2286088.1 hypothetical protein [Rhodoblastus acidophilus]MCW2334982.1 hypothetical protein [Rhodoblastus acidophilus]
MKKIISTVLSLLVSGPAIATEISPTQKMLAEAKRMNKVNYPDAGSVSFEYHFRDIGGHVMWCAYATGGNGNFCVKITQEIVANTDRAARDYCKTADTDEDTPPHAVYGELWDLDYKCKGGRMSRLPLEMALDSEGFVRSQWKPLP